MVYIVAWVQKTASAERTLWGPFLLEKLRRPAFTLDRIARASELVHQRLLRSTGTLEQAGIPYAVAGGSAVKAWVARVDESAVRQIPDG